jgi:hypothetical protein
MSLYFLKDALARRLDGPEEKTRQKVPPGGLAANFRWAFGKNSEKS